MRFSVIIPLYYGAKHIERTLDSVLAQTFKDFEIILVNDGSPDNVGEVVKKYISAHPGVNFKYIEQENKGLGGARNTGIRNSSGQIICLLDQDDLWYAKKLEVVDKAFCEDKAADLVSHAIRIVSGSCLEVFRTGPAFEDMKRALIFRGNLLRTPSVSFKKEMIDKAGLFTEDREKLHLVEDYELWLRMAFAGAKFVFLDDVLAEYSCHQANFSSADVFSLRTMIRGEKAVVEMYYKKLPTKTLSDWYNIRRRVGKIFYSACKKAFTVYKDKWTAGGYLFRAFLLYPLYFAEYLGKKK